GAVIARRCGRRLYPVWIGVALAAGAGFAVLVALGPRLGDPEQVVDLAGDPAQVAAGAAALSSRPQRAASQAQTISWIWWNSMSGSTSIPTGWPANSTAAIGSPVASDFLDPQNWTTRLSRTSKPRRRAVSSVSPSTTASRTQQATVSHTSSEMPIIDQTPSTTPSENAA